MMQYLEGEEISSAELKKALRKATIANKLVPVLCGTAFKNKGVQPLLDAVVSYLPSPVDLPNVTGVTYKGEEPAERRPADDESFSALAFKIMSAPQVGKLAYFRVYSGTLSKGDQVLNTRTGNKERLGRLLEMHADKQQDREVCMTGDIMAAIGMKNVRTGDTLTDDEERHHPRVARLSRSRHRRCGRAKDQGRPREDGKSPHVSFGRRPNVHGQDRRRHRPDHHRWHG
ncbi:MAG: EF-Tu/IF-2/RF-3 family GTPase [Acidimicrobiales bacterium]